MLKVTNLVFLAIIYCILMHSFTEGRVTRKQLETNQKLIRRICQPKYNVTSELIDGMREGKFPQDHNLMCYVGCVMNFTHSTNVDDAIKNLDIFLPEEMREATKAQILACQDAHMNATDKCEAAYNTLKCMTEFNPNNYVFP
uniref:Putative odorant-binding protein 1 cnaphalocrocis medinalis n=1 Tax=Xenopsylla cheopis TaxID=163159 RepID=A0A6M2DXH5_XENCH